MHVEPGDLILVRSRGRGIDLGRRLARSPYDHVAVVVRGGLTTNIDKPASRKLPVARLLRESLSPAVLRPAWQAEAERAAFVDWIESLEGRPYDARRTLALIPRLVLLQRLGLAWPLRPAAAGQERWICTDAVMLGFERMERFREAIAGLPLEWVRLRCATTNDLLALSRSRPDLLQGLPGPEA